MILPDVNVLIYAFRRDTSEHKKCAPWLEELASGRKRVAAGDALVLCDAVVSGFLRIVTNSKIIDPPTPLAEAWAFVEWLIQSPDVQWLASSPSVWNRFEQLSVSDSGIKGNLVPDAYLAALCSANGVALATADRGFARFEGLQVFDPVR